MPFLGSDGGAESGDVGLGSLGPLGPLGPDGTMESRNAARVPDVDVTSWAQSDFPVEMTTYRLKVICSTPETNIPQWWTALERTCRR